jgi:hypothetical protein
MRERLKALVAEADYTAARCHDGTRMMLSWDGAFTHSQATNMATRASAAVERFTHAIDEVLAHERANARELPGIVGASGVARHQSEVYAAAVERAQAARGPSVL